MKFDDEPVLPKLNNLASHVSECKKKDSTTPTQAEHLSEGLNLKRSADMMASYLKDGELNPTIEPTQKGFLRLFLAWILDESLPWTTNRRSTVTAYPIQVSQNQIYPAERHYRP
jgi:hypothetical protein